MTGSAATGAVVVNGCATWFWDADGEAGGRDDCAFGCALFRARLGESEGDGSRTWFRVSGIRPRTTAQGPRSDEWGILEWERKMSSSDVRRPRSNAAGAATRAERARKSLGQMPRETIPSGRNRSAWTGRLGLCVILYTIRGTVVKSAAPRVRGSGVRPRRGGRRGQASGQ
jgi:hypothetical protein